LSLFGGLHGLARFGQLPAQVIDLGADGLLQHIEMRLRFVSFDAAGGEPFFAFLQLFQRFGFTRALQQQLGLRTPPFLRGLHQPVLLVVECLEGRFDRGQRTSTLVAGTDVAQLEATTHDPATQSIQSLHLLIRDGRVETYPVRLRYAFPGELDLMARLAGLALEARWGSWSGEPFTSASGGHISVWRLP